MALGFLIFGLAVTSVAEEEEFQQGEHRPVFSPDGQSIVFMSNRNNGDWELYMIGIDGSGMRRLTRHPGWDGYASFSPDGEWLVFDRSDDTASGPHLLNIATGAIEAFNSYSVTTAGNVWTPNGEHMVYWQEDASGNRDLFMHHFSNGGTEPVTESADMNEHDPAVSPDGNYLAFAVNLDEGSALDILDLTRWTRSRIVSSSGYLYGLSWSHDSTQISYNTDEDGDQDIYLISLDGEVLTRLTDNDVADHLAQFSPDGSRIIFTSERSGSEEIYIMTLADGRIVKFDVR